MQQFVAAGIPEQREGMENSPGFTSLPQVSAHTITPISLKPAFRLAESAAVNCSIKHRLVAMASFDFWKEQEEQ